MAVLTENNFNLVGEIPVVAYVKKAAQNDTFVIPHAGARNITAKLYTGTDEVVTYDRIQIANAGTAYGSATTTLAYDNGTANGRLPGGYYVFTDEGEAIYVIKDSGYDGTSGVLTVKRGALGTTPGANGAGVANDDYLYVTCALKLATETTTGYVVVNYTPLPEDPDTNLLGALKDVSTRYAGWG